MPAVAVAVRGGVEVDGPDPRGQQPGGGGPAGLLGLALRDPLPALPLRGGVAQLFQYVVQLGLEPADVLGPEFQVADGRGGERRQIRNVALATQALPAFHCQHCQHCQH